MTVSRQLLVQCTVAALSGSVILAHYTIFVTTETSHTRLFPLSPLVSLEV